MISRTGHEIVDLLNPRAKYKLLVINNVPRVNLATGGLLQKSPIICGGLDIIFEHNYPTEYTFRDGTVIGQPEKKIKMQEKRKGAASVVLDQTTLWVVGGYNNDNTNQRSTEFIEMDQPPANGPVLPFKISYHSMIQYDEKSIYIIGGWQNYSISNKTWIVDPTDAFKIKVGPSLNVRRAHHGCAKMTLNGRTILVVAGGEGFGYLDSVEILDPTKDNNWTRG